jgi:hypothetical protein
MNLLCGANAESGCPSDSLPDLRLCDLPLFSPVPCAM